MFAQTAEEGEKGGKKKKKKERGKMKTTRFMSLLYLRTRNHLKYLPVPSTSISKKKGEKPFLSLTTTACGYRELSSALGEGKKTGGGETANEDFLSLLDVFKPSTQEPEKMFSMLCSKL